MLGDLAFLGVALVIIAGLYFVLFGKKKGGEKLKAVTHFPFSNGSIISF